MLNNQIKISQVAAVIMALLLVVPYSTGAIWYGFKEGYVPIQPRNYLVGIVALLAVYTLFKRPRINFSIVALLGLITLRIGDTFFLHRVPDLDNLEMLSEEGAALAYSMGIVFLCGDRFTLRYSAVLCGIFTILVCTGMNAWEWQNPGFFSTEEGRSAGMLVNSNDAGSAIVVMLGLVLSMTPPLWLAAGLICSSGVGVFFTLSRGGAIVWLLVTVAYLMIVAQSRLRRIVGFTFWLTLIVFFILKVVDFRSPLSEGGTNSTMSDVSTREKELLGQGEIDPNDDGRVDILLDALKGIQQQPILGYGTGASWSNLFRPHNEFVGVWLDNGIVGMVLFSLGLCLLVVNCISRNKVLLIGCVPLVAEIPFSHNLLENKSYLFAWIILAGMVQFQGEIKLPVASGEGPQDICGNERAPEVLNGTSPAVRL